ncbi:MULTISPECIES: hypothetical protein [unclassified Streptomyces]|uniref:hypothetical protein n=1 Tax=unclassified Streptomyces TaxID=2593676 RepID=UPI003D758BC5
MSPAQGIIGLLSGAKDRPQAGHIVTAAELLPLPAELCAEARGGSAGGALPLRRRTALAAR